jgi:DNA-binding NtrC family response regulator
VRIVAATNRDLRALVNAARFRSDLYYRLAVIRVRLPALRERPEDIPELVQHFLDGFGATLEARARLMAPELLAGLSRAAWPGNVRELRNVVERSLVLESPRFEPERGEIAQGSVPRVDPRLPYNESRRHALDDFEQEYLRALLRAHGGKVSQAAKAAGVGRVYLHRLVRRHGVR